MLFTLYSDYEEVYTVLSFTNTSFVQNVSLTIIDDRLLESEEHFVVTLTQVNEEDRVIIQPESANVTILDNDSEELILFFYHNVLTFFM